MLREKKDEALCSSGMSVCCRQTPKLAAIPFLQLHLSQVDVGKEAMDDAQQATVVISYATGGVFCNKVKKCQWASEGKQKQSAVHVPNSAG